MENQLPPPPPVIPMGTSDERLMAAMAHGSIMIPYIGLLAPIFIWVTQKDKSEFVRFQALQALAFQVLLIAVSILGFACYFGSFIIPFIATAVLQTTHSSNLGPEALLMVLPFLVFGLIGLLSLALGIYGIVAAVMNLTGKDFRYIFIADMVERYLGKKK